MNKILVITGPTAIGKTDLALYLAKKISGELISCDARQVFRGLDLGTGKLPSRGVEYQKYDGFWEMDKVKVWMLDIVSPVKRYDVVEFTKGARKAISDIQGRDRLPIIVGGSGLYLKALLYGLSDNYKINKALRGELERLSLEEVQQKIISLSPALFYALNNSEQNNKRRLIRHIEKLTAENPASKSSLNLNKSDILIIGLTAPKDVLDSRIDQRVDKRIEVGMIEEAENLYKNGLSIKRMRELGLEYRILAEYLEKKLTLVEMVEMLKIKIHQYAKRQLTWFKKQPNINWFDISEKSTENKVEKKVVSWYNLLK